MRRACAKRVNSSPKRRTEYRGPLPAWRIAFDDAEGLAVYVAADTGRVAARRSDLWRVYDALWALHIMDWRDHENFNTGLMIVTSFTALIVNVGGLRFVSVSNGLGSSPRNVVNARLPNRTTPDA
jgi:hypothetical protein